MKFNLLALACALMMAFGLSMGSFAGSIADVDADGVPDVYDNCDADFNNNFGVDLNDLGQMLDSLNTIDAELDLNCNGGVDLNDLGFVLDNLNTLVGPSGRDCAVPNVKGSCPPL
jgi:hypothetical protein